MKRCYSVSTDKGGSGKTTTVVCLAAALAERGTPVLVLDLDRQASASKWFGCEADGDELGELLQAGGDLETLVQPSASAGVDCVPSGPLMLRADEIDTQTAAGHLKAAVAALNARRWRYLLIDCPPSLGALTLAAMASSAGGRAAGYGRSFFLAVPTQNPLIVEVALELTARRDHERLDIGLLRDPSHVFAGKGSDKAIEFDRPAKQVLCGI